MSSSTCRVLLVVVDSLRLDAIAHMPNLLSIVRKSGVIFSNAIANGIPTPYAVPSILSGRYPFALSISNPPKSLTIFHMKLDHFNNIFLSGQHFSTWQVLDLSDNLKIIDTTQTTTPQKFLSKTEQHSLARELWFIVKQTLSNNASTYGFITIYHLLRAFLHPNTLRTEMIAHREHLLFSQLFNWLDAPPSKTIAYIHTNLIHYPYAACGIYTRTAYESLWRAILSAYGLRAEQDILTHILHTKNAAITNAIHASLLKKLKTFYLLSVRNIDKLITSIVKKALSKKFFIIIISDHGEMLGDYNTNLFSHRTYYHLPTVFRIPIILLVPEVHHRTILRQLFRNRHSAIGQIDIVPTILDILDINPSSRMDGQSLLQPVNSDRIREVWSIEDGFRLMDKYGLGSTPHEMKPILTVLYQKQGITLRDTECFPLRVGCSEELKDYAIKKIRFFHLRKNISLKGGNQNG